MCLCLFMAPGFGREWFLWHHKLMEPSSSECRTWDWDVLDNGDMESVVSELLLKRICVRRVPVPWKQKDVFISTRQHVPLGSAGLGTACARTAHAVAQYRHTRRWQKRILIRTGWAKASGSDLDERRYKLQIGYKVFWESIQEIFGLMRYVEKAKA